MHRRRRVVAACLAPLALMLGVASGCTVGPSTGSGTGSVAGPAPTVTVTVTVTAAAPGSPAVPQPSASSAGFRRVNPCELVTQPEAESLAQTKLLAGVLAGADSDQSNCTYAGPTSGPLAQVEVMVGPGTKKFLDIDRQLNHVFTAVAGLGDEAYQEDFVVFFRKGDQWYGLRLVRLDPPEKYAAAMVGVAKTMASRA